MFEDRSTDRQRDRLRRLARAVWERVCSFDNDLWAIDIDGLFISSDNIESILESSTTSQMLEIMEALIAWVGVNGRAHEVGSEDPFEIVPIRLGPGPRFDEQLFNETDRCHGRFRLGHGVSIGGSEAGLKWSRDWA